MATATLGYRCFVAAPGNTFLVIGVHHSDDHESRTLVAPLVAAKETACCYSEGGRIACVSTVGGQIVARYRDGHELQLAEKRVGAVA